MKDPKSLDIQKKGKLKVGKTAKEERKLPVDIASDDDQSCCIGYNGNQAEPYSFETRSFFCYS